MRLIDADALIKTLGLADDCQACQYKTFIFCNRSPDFVVACEAITDAPTIDAVEVVRCRDCKYGAQDDFGGWFCVSFYCTVGNEDGSGFCSDGERREDGKH